jgi:hypothetical protein
MPSVVLVSARQFRGTPRDLTQLSRRKLPDLCNSVKKKGYRCTTFMWAAGRYGHAALSRGGNKMMQHFREPRLYPQLGPVI